MSILLVGAVALTTPHLDALELKSYDFLLTVLRGPAPAPDDLVIVAIDESSIKEFSSSFSWPWPRSVHAELIRRLNAAGARAIVFDVLFDTASAPEEDGELAAAIKESRAPVVLAETIDRVDDAKMHLVQRIVPLPALTAAGARVGSVAIAPDVDGEIRRAPLEVGGRPTLAVAALSAGGAAFEAASVPAVLRGGDPGFLVNFAGPGRTVPTVSYYQAIDPAALPPETFRGKTVFVGRSLTAQELARGAASQDLFATPFDALLPGVEIHANAMETLARRAFIRRAPAGLVWLVMLLAGGVIAAVMTFVPLFRTKILIAVVMILAVPVLAAVVFLRAGYWLYTVQPMLVSVAVFGANALYQYRTSERDRRFVRKALTGYVSKQVMQRLLENPAALDLGGVQVDATVLFTDIAGFSSISERMSSRDLASLLNDYFTRVGDAIMAGDGMIDKYIGDAIMAVWGAPLADDRHASKACAAALAMKRVVEEMGGPVRARIGINTGPMMAGNLGHRERMAYTVIGDSVNLASRLEGANKQYGTAILVSESTWRDAAPDFVFRRVDRIRVVGKHQPVGVYELMAPADGPDAGRCRARAAAFAEIVDAYDRREWAIGLDEAAGYRAQFPEPDPVVDVYVERLRVFAAAPPPDDWDGVFNLHSK